MDQEKSFRTKSGFCHILPDKVILTRDGIIGDLSQLTMGNNVSRILLIYGGLSAAFLYFSFDSYKKEEITQAILLAVLAVYLIYTVAGSLNNSATPVIERKAIKKVKFKKSIPGLTRSRFEIFFEDKQGKIKKRLILLPGSLTDGQYEAEKALQMMLQEKVMTN